MDVKSKPRRRYSAQFKAEVIAACNEPGASVAAIARRFELNDNLVRQWRRGRGSGEIGPQGDSKRKSGKAEFVALSLPAQLPCAAAASPVEVIRIEFKREATSVSVSWSASAAAQCVMWLQELLR